MQEVASDQRAEGEVLEEVVAVEEGTAGERSAARTGRRVRRAAPPCPGCDRIQTADSLDAARRGVGCRGLDRRRADRPGHAGDGAGRTLLRAGARAVPSRRSSSAHHPTIRAKTTVLATTDV